MLNVRLILAFDQNGVPSRSTPLHEIKGKKMKAHQFRSSSMHHEAESVKNNHTHRRLRRHVLGVMLLAASLLAAASALPSNAAPQTPAMQLRATPHLELQWTGELRR
jgi:hypothetical protein